MGKERTTSLRHALEDINRYKKPYRLFACEELYCTEVGNEWVDLIAIYNIEERQGKKGEDWFMRVIHIEEDEEAAPSDPPSAGIRVGREMVQLYRSKK